MASIGGGLAGAAGGFAAGGPVGAALAGLGGLLGGGGGQMTAAQKAALNQQRQIANQLYSYGSSRPMTNQADLQNLAQAQGLQGQQERSNLGSLASFGNPMTPTGGQQDMMGNLMQNDAANRMSLGEQHMADAIASRRQALLEASGVNQQAYNMASGPGATPNNGLGKSLSGVAQSYAFNKANKGGSGSSTPTTIPPPNQGLIPDGADQSQNEGGASVQSAPGQGPPAAGGGFNPQGFTPQDQQMWNMGNQMQAGVGDAPSAPQQKHDPMMHAMTIIHQIISHHLELAKIKAKSKADGKPKRKRKPSSNGAGDAPAMPLPGYTASGMASPQSPQGMQPGQQGAGAPGNEPGGRNGQANQIRQPQSSMLDRLRMPGGLQLPY